VAAVLVVIVDALIGLTLALLLGGAAGTIAAAILAALAIVPLVGATELLASARLDRLVPLLLLASIVVVPRDHWRSPAWRRLIGALSVEA
jgi:glucose-6-phosphate-specific signal transduction histidine kinase